MRLVLLTVLALAMTTVPAGKAIEPSVAVTLSVRVMANLSPCCLFELSSHSRGIETTPLAVVPRGTWAVWEVEELWGVRLRMPFAPGEFTCSAIGEFVKASASGAVSGERV